MADGKVLSQAFEFRRADKPKDDFSLRFNWTDGVVRSGIPTLTADDADAIRDGLERAGVSLEDGPRGTRWVRK